MLILALVGVAAFVVIGGVGTVLFLKRDAIMAKFKKPGVVQNSGTETEPTNVSPQPPAPAPEVVKPNPPAPKPVEPPKPVVKPVEPPKPPVATVPKETVPNRPADVKPATPPKQENVEFGLADQTEKPNAKAPQTEATKPVQQPAQQVTQPVQQVTQPVVQQGQNGLMRLGSFEDGGVVLFGANDGRNTSFFRELSKNETFKAVGFQEASKNVQQWCDQLGEIQGNGPAFVIVSISVNRNDFQFKKMMQGLIKTLPSNNAVVLLATSNEDVMDEVRQNCDTVGMFYRKWGSNKELVTYIVDLKKELGW